MTDRTDPDRPLWVPPASRVAASQMESFRRVAADAAGRQLQGYADLHRWSVEDPAPFWSVLWEHLVPGVPLVGPSLVDGGHMTEATWYPEVTLNVADLDAMPLWRPNLPLGGNRAGQPLALVGAADCISRGVALAAMSRCQRSSWATGSYIAS